MDSFPGNLITIEGIDGSGKSTLIERLSATDIGLKRPQLEKTREQTHGDIGKTIRSHLSANSFNSITELHLFIADHSNHLETTIKPALSNGRVVISDRYYDSRQAYQALELKDHVDNPLNHILELHQPWTITPELTLLLDVQPETAIQRIDSNEKYESLSTLQEVRENYLEIAKRHPARFSVIDAEQPPDKVKTDAIEEINRVVNNRPDTP